MRSSVGTKMAAQKSVTERDPMRAICEPATGMQDSEPRPKTRMTSPSSASLSERRLANSGIIGAQEPIMKPFIRNSRETPKRFFVI